MRSLFEAQIARANGISDILRRAEKRRFTVFTQARKEAEQKRAREQVARIMKEGTP